jgi:hypothetical protein
MFVVVRNILEGPKVHWGVRFRFTELHIDQPRRNDEISSIPACRIRRKRVEGG